MSDTIDLTVLDDMRLAISPHEIGRDAEHNSATFKVTQPAALDQYSCRAEVKTAAGTTYRLVTGGEFSLTNDITVQGHGQIQLAYSDGTQVMKKTTLAPFHITESLNAVDPGAPGFGDGLAQLQGAAFAKAEIQATTLAFRNIGGTVVDTVLLPGGAQDLDANYLRRDGANQMGGTILIEGSNRGLVFDWQGISPAIYTDGTTMRLRRPVSNQEITIEDNGGAPASRSNVMTQVTCDARYLTPLGGDGRYLQQSGGAMSGTISFAAGQGFAFQPGGSAIQEQGGALTARHGAGQFSPILTVGDSDYRYLSVTGGPLAGPLAASYDGSAPSPSHLVTRNWVDGAKLSLTGGIVNGILSMAAGQPFISAMGTGSNPMLCIGSNDSGYWRTGGNILFEVGRTPTWLYTATGTTTYYPLTLPTAAPTLANHAASKGYVDQLRAPSLLVALGNLITLTTTFQNIVTTAYAIPRGGNSRVLVTLSGGLRMGTAGQVGVLQVRCTPSDITQNVFVYSVPDGPNVVSSGVHLSFPVDVSGTAPALSVEIRVVGAAPPGLILVGGAGEEQRTTVTITDAGAR